MYSVFVIRTLYSDLYSVLYSEFCTLSLYSELCHCTLTLYSELSFFNLTL